MAQTIKLFKICGKIINKFENKTLNSINNTQASSITHRDRLSKPTITINDTTLTVSGVQDATSHIYINGTLKTSTTATTVDLIPLVTQGGVYKVKVQQRKANLIDSLFSDEVTFIAAQLDTPTALAATDTLITFDRVDAATLYEVFADGISIGESAGVDAQTVLVADTTAGEVLIDAAVFATDSTDSSTLVFE